MFALLSRMIFGVAPRLTDETLTRVELARLEGTVSALVKELQAFRESIGAQYIDHEHRIRVNERWRLTMPPTVLTSIVAFVVSVWHH